MAALFAEQKFPAWFISPRRPACAIRSIDPHAYVDTNLTGFSTCSRAAATTAAEHLVFASSSRSMAPTPRCRSRCTTTSTIRCQPLRRHEEGQRADGAHLRASVRLPATGLRFFTVYGPWGRPDMAMLMFTKAILAASRSRCSTTATCGATSPTSTTSSKASCALVDARRGQSEWTGDDAGSRLEQRAVPHLQHRQQQPGRASRFIAAARRRPRPEGQARTAADAAGDVPATYADVDDLVRDVGFRPATPIEEGIRRFIEWYRAYHRV